MRRARPILALRGLFAGGRLLICASAGLACYLALPDSLRLPVRIASSWVFGVALFLALTAFVIVEATPDYMRRRARRQDSSRSVILAVILTGASISLVALGFTLHKQPDETALALAARVALVGATVASSWTLVHTIFALHYAHHYYGDGSVPGPDDDRGGLAFPGGGAPDYWDFLYFSFVVGMTCQVSDVQVTSQPMRRITLGHGVLSFFFNTVILALAINLLASSF